MQAGTPGLCPATSPTPAISPLPPGAQISWRSRPPATGLAVPWSCRAPHRRTPGRVGGGREEASWKELPPRQCALSRKGHELRSAERGERASSEEILTTTQPRAVFATPTRNQRWDPQHLNLQILCPVHPKVPLGKSLHGASAGGHHTGHLPAAGARAPGVRRTRVGRWTVAGSMPRALPLLGAAR